MSYELSDHDAKLCMRQNKRNDWRFSAAQLMRLIREHKRAYVENLGLDFRYEKKIFANERRMAMISYRLEDANYHKLAALLDRHEYDAAAQWIKEAIFAMRIASSGYYIQAMAYDQTAEIVRVLRLLLDGDAKCCQKETEQIVEVLYNGIEQGKSADEVSSILDARKFSCLRSGYRLDEE